MPVGAQSTETILVVDDQAVALEFCAAILRTNGYTVLTAPSGKSALALVRSVRPNIILALIDIVMPEMNGIELIKSLERLNPPKRIILMSGYAPEEVKTLVGSEAADYRCIWNPFEAESLLRLVRNALVTDANSAR